MQFHHMPEFFIDSATPSEIEKGLNFDIVNGVTTNPSLLRKGMKEFFGTEDAPIGYKRLLNYKE